VILQILAATRKVISLTCAEATPQFERGFQWLLQRQQAAFFSTGVVVAFLLLMFGGVTAAVAAVAAWIALMRHFAQTDADRQRRITESYSKAVEQLAHEKIEVRLGGIYSLERISRESRADYWVVMETLAAFVRERAHWSEANIDARVPTDIAAVLSVIGRRPQSERMRERREHWHFNFFGSDLRHASLEGVHLESANFAFAHLEGAFLTGAYLQGAIFAGAHLEGAFLSSTLAV
jgi:hypothetical protein